MMRCGLMVGVLALAGCGFFRGEATDVATQQLQGCGAEGFVDQMGEPLRDAVLPRGPEVRVVTPSILNGAALANDDPNRLNLQVDEAGVIIGVYCG